ncbi:MAG: hypothetical protein ACTSVM_01850, partial [Candidatus Ranarchaeia archaeon]
GKTFKKLRKKRQPKIIELPLPKPIPAEPLSDRKVPDEPKPVTTEKDAEPIGKETGPARQGQPEIAPAAKEARRCSNCGSIIPEGVEYCEKCGW